ncbi:MAG: alpha/beta hydrolase [Pseudomonadota bacterium]
MDLTNLLPLPPLDVTQDTPIRPQDQAYFDRYGLNFDVAHRFGGIACRSGGQSVDIACHVFQPESLRGTLFFIHGLFDHSGLLRHVIKEAVDSGYSVCVFDLPGHGLSSGERAVIRSFHDYLDVFHQVLDAMASHLPSPWHAAAQSTGASVLMLHMVSAERVIPFQSHVVFSPLVRPHLWSLLQWPYFVLRRFITQRRRVFTDNSSDTKFVAFVRNDPLQPTILSLTWLDAMHANLKQFLRTPVCDIPLTVFQGTNDTTVDWRFNVKAIRRHFSQADIQLLDGAGHHVINERESIRVQWAKQLRTVWRNADNKVSSE